jgi:lipoprotein-anchoring transpeptidase ErfK/SrfK
MFLRLGAAAVAAFIVFPLGQAAAQYSQPSYRQPGTYSEPSAYPMAPPFVDGGEESINAAPSPQGSVPAAATGESAAPPAPDFVYSNRDVAAPAPASQTPGFGTQRSDAVPGEDMPPRPPGAIGPQPPSDYSALPPEDQPELGPPQELPPQLRRQIVNFPAKERPGTIIIDTGNTYLYFVLGDGKAIRYGIGVGREGFTWAGTERISRKAEWPDWYPPQEMIERQPYLPRFMAGGESNPLGARALYLGHTLYRIHGTNQPSTIGKFVSSGCVRLLNVDIEDLYDRVKVGTRVIVLPGQPPATAQADPIAAAPPADPAVAVQQ